MGRLPHPPGGCREGCTQTLWSELVRGALEGGATAELAVVGQAGRTAAAECFESGSLSLPLFPQ